MKKRLNDIKNKIVNIFNKKLFWCELLIIISFFIFTTVNFMLNFFVGMYILSLSLFLIGIFVWKYL